MIFPVFLSFQLPTSIFQILNIISRFNFNIHFKLFERTNSVFCKNLSFPTGTRTSLQVEYNSYVLVGGIGSLLLYCIFLICAIKLLLSFINVSLNFDKGELKVSMKILVNRAHEFLNIPPWRANTEE